MKSTNIMRTSRIYEYSAYKPEYNFPGRETNQNPEAVFAEQFALSYQRRFIEIHSRTSKKQTLFIREVPISEHGIPDLLVFNWTYNTAISAISQFLLKDFTPTIRAFEIKISNWRKGLMQAHRYRYFSHASFLVLPWNKIRLVKAHLNVFKTLRIGLWLFAPESDRIINIFTPRPQKPKITKYTQKAIELTAKAISS